MKKTKESCSKCRLGLTLGIFFALIHAVWAVLVGLGVGQKVIDWILPLHFVMNVFTVMPFTWGTAIMLAVMAFIGGYVMGWVFAALWNMLAKK